MQKNEFTISLRDISKMYRLYDKQLDRLKDALPLFSNHNHREFWALHNISLDIRKGETLGVIGVNGSGKSTLLQIVCGLLQPTQGQVHIQGRISALLELGSGFNPMESGRDNVYLQGAILGLSRQEIDECYEKILKFADIGDFINQPVKNYSSGMMVRLAFSVAVQVDPEILIIDEALSVGDVFFQSKCFRKFEELRSRGVTILVVSHQLDSIQSLCDRAIFLDQGRVLCEGAPREVIEAYQKHAGTISSRREESAKLEQTPHKSPSTTSIDSLERPIDEPLPQRYGNGKAHIANYSVNGMQNCSEVTVNSSKLLNVSLSCNISEAIETPVIGIRINTLNGFQVFGNNTTFANIPMEKCTPGKTLSLTFEQVLHLNRGSYMLTIVIAEWTENGTVEYVDRFVDAVHLHLADGPYPYAGLCNLQGKITINSSTNIEINSAKRSH